LDKDRLSTLITDPCGDLERADIAGRTADLPQDDHGPVAAHFDRKG
jgi:hypothetical protein